MPERWQYIKERCYYRTLGVPSTATATEIKVAYRSLAKKLHPDRNPDPACKELFARVEEAYAFLEREEQRGLYDALGGDLAIDNNAALSHLNGDIAIAPPQVNVDEIHFGEFRQGESTQGQQVVDFRNLNQGALTLQLLPTSGQFWSLRRSDADGLRLLIRTTALNELEPGNYFDIVRAYWQEHPDSSIDVPIRMSVSSSVELPPGTLPRFIRYWFRRKSQQFDRMYEKWDKSTQVFFWFLFCCLVAIAGLSAFIGLIALLAHLFGVDLSENPLHRGPPTSHSQTP